jgi:hypothetical protein
VGGGGGGGGGVVVGGGGDDDDDEDDNDDKIIAKYCRKIPDIVRVQQRTVHNVKTGDIHILLSYTL